MTDNKMKRGFTLIELLVVIAVISVLASLLLPALAGARSLVKRTTCANSMRQIATSAMLYAVDYNGWLPPTNTVDFMYPCNTYLNLKNEAPSSFSTTTVLQKNPSSLLVCPTANQPKSSPCWDGGAAATYFRTNYAPTLASSINDDAGGWKNYLPGWAATSDTRRIDKIRDGSVLMGEQNYITSTWSGGVYYSSLSWSYPTGSNASLNDTKRHAFNHNNSSNYLFKDGHVASHPYNSLQFLDANALIVN